MSEWSSWIGSPHGQHRIGNTSGGPTSCSLAELHSALLSPSSHPGSCQLPPHEGGKFTSMSAPHSGAGQLCSGSGSGAAGEAQRCWQVSSTVGARASRMWLRQQLCLYRLSYYRSEMPMHHSWGPQSSLQDFLAAASVSHLVPADAIWHARSTLFSRAVQQCLATWHAMSANTVWCLVICLPERAGRSTPASQLPGSSSNRTAVRSGPHSAVRQGQGHVTSSALGPLSPHSTKWQTPTPQDT